MSSATSMAARFRREIEGLRRVGRAPVKSEAVHERLLESVFLNGMTEFESFLEEMFFAAVSKKVRPGNTKPVVSLRDPKTARSLVLRPREHYLNWLPYEQSQERADQFLRDGSPFSRLGSRPAVINRLGVAMAVRNAIAHKGGSAHTRFRDATGRRYPSPGQYLAAALGKSTVCDAFLADFVRFGKALCVSDVEALKLLGPEGPFPTGKKLEPGKYKCIDCGATYALKHREAIACPVCDPPCGACGAATSRGASFQPA